MTKTEKKMIGFNANVVLRFPEDVIARSNLKGLLGGNLSFESLAAMNAFVKGIFAADFSIDSNYFITSSPDVKVQPDVEEVKQKDKKPKKKIQVRGGNGLEAVLAAIPYATYVTIDEVVSVVGKGQSPLMKATVRVYISELYKQKLIDRTGRGLYRRIIKKG